jgi:periplasmic protein TonB
MNSPTFSLPAVAIANLPPLTRGHDRDALTPTQRRALLVAIVAIHVAGAWGLMQVAAVREAVLEAAPMFVDLIAPTAPPVPPAPPPSRPQPVQKKKPAPVIAAAPSPAPSQFTVAAQPVERPFEAPAPDVPVAIEAPPAPPSPVAPPKLIPASSVEYLVPPALVYPRLSEKAGERGRVMVRVFIDMAGLPQNVQVSVSSGHARLDEAAVAAVRGARFKPYTENGRPSSGWAIVPANFE